MNKKVENAVKLSFKGKNTHSIFTNYKIIELEPADWAENYKMKLRFCWKIANFQADTKKNPEEVEFREQKRNILIELIDILDNNEASSLLLNQETLAESMIMISKNVYRTFTNKSKSFVMLMLILLMTCRQQKAVIG